ncbi:hypothetical protein BST61_g10962 [Cercospora zeina]
MPLHLLGKKSWNVYNATNISRVRKDEAEAQAREEAAEQQTQEEDAARRIALLRGEVVTELSVPENEEQKDSEYRRQHGKRFGEDETYASRDRKRKRRRGEDDTDRDMRYAREDRERGERAREVLLLRQGNSSSAGRDAAAAAAAEAPLQDHAGHIQLFAPPDEKELRAKQKNDEAEAEKAKKRKREEDLMMMKFSNAAGYDNGMQKPWYAAADTSRQVEGASRNEIMLAELKGKDVWGNEDPRRTERETKRIVSSDPFAMMQSAQKQLKQSEKDKEEWERRRRRGLEELKRAQRRKGEDDEDDVDSLDGFHLDAPAKDTRIVREMRRADVAGDNLVGRVRSGGVGQSSTQKGTVEAIVTDIGNRVEGQ